MKYFALDPSIRYQVAKMKYVIKFNGKMEEIVEIMKAMKIQLDLVKYHRKRDLKYRKKDESDEEELKNTSK